MVASNVLLIVMATVCFVIILKQRIQQRSLLSLVDDAIDSPINGVVLFDHQQRYWRHNRNAEKFLPILASQAKRPGTVSGLLAYMQDNGIDLDPTTRRILDRNPSQSDLAHGFSEVIGWGGDRMCLVQFQPTCGGGTMVVLVDISHSVSQEEQLMHLSQENHDLVAAIEAIESGVIISDLRRPHNPIIFVNRFFTGLLAVPRDEVIGNDWRFVMDALGNYGAAERIEEAIRKREVIGIEFSLPHAKEELWLSLQISPVTSPNGGPELCVGILTDVTSVKVREALFSQAQRLEALGQLAGGVAHDFNNVLSIIDGYGRLSQNACKGQCNRPTHEYLERIRAAVQRGAALTRRLLAFGRHSAYGGKPVDLGVLVADQLALLRPLVEEDIEIEVRVPDIPAFVECPPDAVGNILMNLVINSKDAMPRSGTITVGVEHCERADLPLLVREKYPDVDFLRLTVSDTGEGIPKENLSRIFDPFFTTKQIGKGTGLGLSMVYGLVTEMGGHIEVSSEPGKGTEMSVFMPVAHVPLAKAVSGDTADIGSLRFEGFTALVVEDEPDLLVLVASLLEEHGMIVLKAGDGNEALVVQDDHDGDIDLLLSDVVMPEMNGIKLAELVRSLRPETRVVFMSGYPSGGEMSRYDLPDDIPLLPKPVDPRELLLLVSGLFGETPCEDTYGNLEAGNEQDEV